MVSHICTVVSSAEVIILQPADVQIRRSSVLLHTEAANDEQENLDRVCYRLRDDANH